MAPFNFRRKRRLKARGRGAAPLLPEPLGLSIPARRVNRVVAAVALLGAVGTVALAAALTPGAQTSPSRANASQATLAISEAETPAAAAEPASPPMPVVAALPQRAAKSDLLVPRLSTTRSAVAERSPDRQPLPGSVQEPAAEREFVAAVEAPDTRGDLVSISKPDLKSDIEQVSSDAPAPGDMSADSADEVTRGPGTEAIAEALAVVSAEAIAEAGLDAIADVDHGTDAEATGDAVSKVTDEPTVEVTEDPISGVTDEPAVEITETREASLQPSDEVLPIPAPKPEVKTRLSSVTRGVNLRSRPQNGSKVITVVPGRGRVEVIGCDYWCEVIYEGKRGYIYKSFIRRTKS